MEGDGEKGSPIWVYHFGDSLKGMMVPTMWNGDFDAKSNMGGHLNFVVDFPNDYKIINQMGARHTSIMVETNLLRILMLEPQILDTHFKQTNLL